MAVRCIWASHWCHRFDSAIVRDFRVDLLLVMIGSLENSIVDSMVCWIVGWIVGLNVGLIVG